MIIATRMRKVREIKGWKQASVAASMSITQQAFSFLEQGYGSPRVDTLKRFCEVMKIELYFLLAYDVPVTEETLDRFGSKGFFELITNYKQMEQKLEVYSQLLLNKNEHSTSIQTPNRVAA